MFYLDRRRFVSLNNWERTLQVFVPSGIPASTDSLTLAEHSATITQVIATSSDGLTLAEYTAGISINTSANTDTLVLAEYAATITTTIPASIDTLTLAEYTAAFSINLTTGIDTLTLAEYTSNVNAELNFTSTTDALTLAEYASTITSLIPGGIDALTLAEYVATITSLIPGGIDTLTLVEYTAAFSINLTTGIDTLTLAEYTSNVNAELNFTSTTDALTLAEYTATITTTIPASIDTLTLAEYVSNVNAETSFVSTTDALTLVEYTSGLLTAISSSIDTLTLVEYAAGFTVNFTSTTDALTLAEYAATITTTVPASVDTLTLAEYAATITTTVPASIDTLTLAEYAANITIIVQASIDSLSLTELISTVDVATNISTTSVNLPLDIYAAFLAVNVVGITDALVLDEYVAEVNAELVIDCTSISYTTSPYAATILISVPSNYDNLTLTEYTAGFTVNPTTLVDNLSLSEYSAVISTTYIPYSIGNIDAPVYYNEILWSNNYGNATYVKTRASVSWTTSVPGPTNTIGSWKFIEDSTASNTHALQTGNYNVVANTLYTAQVKLKGAERTKVTVRLSSGANGFGRVVDTSTGVVTAISDFGTGVYSSHTIQGLSDGWWLFTITGTVSTTNVSGYLELRLRDASSETYTGNGTNGAYVADMMVEYGGVAHTYIETEHTPLRSDQIIARAIAPYNFSGFSADYNMTPWAKVGLTNTTEIITYNNEQFTKLKENASTSEHYIEQFNIIGNAASLVTVMCHITSADRKLYFRMFGDTTGNVFYYVIDLSNGTINTASAVGTGGLHSFSAIQLGTTTVDGVPNTPVWELIFRGWASTVSTTTYNRIRFQNYSTTASYTGDISKGVYLGKVQVVNGYTLPNVPSDIVTAIAPLPTRDWNFAVDKTLPAEISFSRSSSATYFDQNGTLQEATSGTPRFTHSPINLSSLGLLIEPTRTNYIRNNTMQGASSGVFPTNWSQSLGRGLTVTSSAPGVENGIEYIDINVTGTTTEVINGATLVRFEPVGTIPAVSGEDWTGSCFIKLVSGDFTNITAFSLGVEEYDSNSSWITGSYYNYNTTTLPLITNLREGRNSITRRFNQVTATYITCRLILSANSGVAINLTLRVGLPQLEKGTIPTSVIKTTSASVQRSADDVKITGSNFSNFWNSTAGSLYIRAIPNHSTHSSATANYPRMIAAVGTNSDTDELGVYAANHTGSVIGKPVAIASVSGTTQAEFSSQLTGVVAGDNVTAFAFAPNDFAASVTASPLMTDTVGTLPTVQELRFFGAARYQPAWPGTISRVTYWNKRLNNAQIQNLAAHIISPFNSNINSATINEISTTVVPDGLIRYTEDQTQTSVWARTNIHAVTAEGVSADGYPAYKVDCNTTNSTHSLGTATFSKTLSDSSLVTAFADVKADERSFCHLAVRDKGASFPGAYFNLSTGAVGTLVSGGAGAIVDSGIESRGSGWYRCRIVVNVHTGGTTPGYALFVASADNNIWFAGIGANDGILVSRCFAVEGNIPMSDADKVYTKVGVNTAFLLDKSSAIVQVPSISLFENGQSHIGTRLNTSIPLKVYDGLSIGYGLINLKPYYMDRLGTLGAGPYGWAPPGAAQNYDSYIYVVSGAGTSYPTTSNFTPTQASTVRFKVYNTTTNQWLSDNIVNFTFINIAANTPDLTVNQSSGSLDRDYTTILKNLVLAENSVSLDRNYTVSYKNLVLSDSLVSNVNAQTNVNSTVELFNLAEYRTNLDLNITFVADSLVITENRVSLDLAFTSSSAALIMVNYNPEIITPIFGLTDNFVLTSFDVTISDPLASVGIPISLSYKMKIEDNRSPVITVAPERVQSLKVVRKPTVESIIIKK